MQVTFTLRREEFVATVRRVTLRQPSVWLVDLIGVACIVGGLATSDPGLAGLGVVYIVLWTCWLWLFVPGRAWRRLSHLTHEQTITLSDEGVHVQLADAESTTEWSYWSDWRLFGDVYVLRAGRGRGQALIPRRAFTGEQQERAFSDEVSRGLASSAPATG